MAVKRGKSRYAVLGMLALQPMSGYDIRGHFEHCLGSIWNESYGNIYPVLKTLLEEGLVTSETHKHPGRPDRLVYALTDAGELELQAWLQADADTDLVRQEAVLKVLFAHAAEPELTQTHLQAFAQRCADKIQQAHEFTAMTHQLGSDRPQARHMLAVANYVIMTQQAALNWAQQTANELAANTSALKQRAHNELARWQNTGKPDGA